MVVAAKVENITALAEDVQKVIQLKRAWLAESRGEIVIRCSPRPDGTYGIKINAQA